MKYRVLVCDDSALVRIVLKKIIDSDPELEVIGVARNGEDVIEQAKRLNPDVITMDVNMPVVDGVTALKEIVKEKIAPVIMISSLTVEGANTTIESIEEGAFDYIAKPEGNRSFHDDSTQIKKKLKKAVVSDVYKKLYKRKGTQILKTKQTKPDFNLIKPVKRIIKPNYGFKVVALGMSTGGPKSIFEVLPHLPANLNAAIIIVQHMPASFIKVFAKRIDSKTQMKCYESEPGMVIEPGNIYVSRGDYHLNLRKKGAREVMIRQKDTPKSLFMPSVDEMMNSVSNVFYSDTIGVLMTGMGRDGAEGMVQILKNGGITIAESEESAIVFGMPKEAIKKGGATYVLPNWQIANKIIEEVERMT